MSLKRTRRRLAASASVLTSRVRRVLSSVRQDGMRPRVLTRLDRVSDAHRLPLAVASILAHELAVQSVATLLSAGVLSTVVYPVVPEPFPNGIRSLGARPGTRLVLSSLAITTALFGSRLFDWQGLVDRYLLQ